MIQTIPTYSLVNSLKGRVQYKKSRSTLYGPVVYTERIERESLSIYIYIYIYILIGIS